MRRGIALGAGLLILILLVIGVKACQDSAHKDALRTWNREAGSLVSQSDSEVGKQYYDTLKQGASQSPEDLQTQISSLRVQAETILDQARKLDTPSELVPAQEAMLIALELRRDGLDYVASHISAALGDQGDVADQAIRGISSQHQAFLASNVLFQTRVTPVDADVIKKNSISATPVATDTNAWMPGFSWLNPTYVADQLGTRVTTSKPNPNQPIAPGLHGTGLNSTAIGAVTLQPDPAANKVPISGDLTFKVTFTNQGDNDEFDIVVEVTLQGSGKPIKAKKTVDTLPKGQQTTVNLALPKKPTAGEVYTVTANVKPVPGEKKTDNNHATYNVLFQ